MWDIKCNKECVCLASHALCDNRRNLRLLQRLLPRLDDIQRRSASAIIHQDLASLSENEGATQQRSTYPQVVSMVAAPVILHHRRVLALPTIRVLPTSFHFQAGPHACYSASPVPLLSFFISLPSFPSTRTVFRMSISFLISSTAEL